MTEICGSVLLANEWQGYESFLDQFNGRRKTKREIKNLYNRVTTTQIIIIINDELD